MTQKIPVVAVTGPTAAGKTAFGIGLARKFGGEIVSCDSMQVYRGLPIGTAQPTGEELEQAPHHLISFLDWDAQFSVSDYVELAGKTVSEIYKRGNLPILVGGTGLYARSLLRGFSFQENVRDEELRRELFRQAETEGIDDLYRELQLLDPVSAEQIHPNNVKRVIRAVEYCRLAGEPFSEQARRSQTAESPYRSLMLCVSFRDREKLYARIDRRVDNMLEQGLLEEAETFYRFCKENGTPATAAQAIGYKELFPYFEGQVSLEEAVENIKRESRRYAKRQITWFRREQDVIFLYQDEWKDPGELLQEGCRLVGNFLENKELHEIQEKEGKRE